MSLYESVLVMAQDVSSVSVDKSIDEFEKVLVERDGKILKKEYWGMRPLAYEIKGNHKAHYTMLYIEGDYSALTEYARKVKLSEDVIKFINFKVNKMTHTPLLDALDTTSETKSK